MAKTEAKIEAKARMVAKVIRADGTEETFVSEDISVTDVNALEQMLAGHRQSGERQATAEDVERINAEESERNEAANAAAENQENDR